MAIGLALAKNSGGLSSAIEAQSALCAINLMRDAELAAVAAGASLWYVPPQSLRDRAVWGPNVNSDGSGGISEQSGGLVGRISDHSLVTPGNFATQATTAGKPQLVNAPGAAGFGALSFDGVTDQLIALTTPVPTSETFVWAGTAPIANLKSFISRNSDAWIAGTTSSTAMNFWVRNSSVWQQQTIPVDFGEACVIACTMSAAGCQVFKNGVLQSTPNLTTYAPGNLPITGIRLGNYTGVSNFYYNGTMALAAVAPGLGLGAQALQFVHAQGRLGAHILGVPYAA